MGAFASPPPQSSSSEPPQTLPSTMVSPSPPPPPAPPNPEPSQQPIAQIPTEEPNPSAADEAKQGGEGEVVVVAEGEEEEEEEAECGFCLFMKEGGCKDPFVAWEECVKDAEKSGEDVVEKCAKATVLLKKCMDAHADYYEPLLRAEQAMADAITNDADSERREEVKVPQPEITIEKDEAKPPS